MEFDLGRNLSTPAPGILPIADSRSYTVTLTALWIPIFIAISLLWYGRLESPLAHVPLVSTGKSSFWDIGHKKAKESFAANARKIVAKGFQQVQCLFWNWVKMVADEGLGWQHEAVQGHLRSRGDAGPAALDGG